MALKLNYNDRMKRLQTSIDCESETPRTLYQSRQMRRRPNSKGLRKSGKGCLSQNAENSKTVASRRLPYGTKGKHTAGTEGVGDSTLLRKGCDGDGGK